MKKRYRYPGSKPFDSSEQDIFFGREQDTIALTKFIELEQSVVIYGKSGIGKSSLIEAGIIPEILKKGYYHPIRIRFGAYTKGKTAPPVQIARDTINIEEGTWLKDIQIEVEQSLWHTIKNRQIQEKHKGYLLVFDQFEELFTYPDKLVKSFARQLAEILYTNIPERFRQEIEVGFGKNDNFLSDAQMQQLHQPIDLKILMGIRSDRMSLMNKLKPFLPDVLLHTYEIQSLDLIQAEEAILNPVYMENDGFIVPRFDYSNDALDNILYFLTDGNRKKIESFQLQILCRYIERKVIDENLKEIKTENIGHIPTIYSNHYLNEISKIGTKEEQIAARKFIEEGLIFEEEERRLSIYEGQIHKQYNVNEGLLRKIVDTHLIRREPSMLGEGYTYELSHDTLVSPVLKAKNKRIEEERQLIEIEKERLRQQELVELNQKAENERLRAEKEKKLRKRANLLSLIALLFAASAALAGVYAYTQAQKVEATNTQLDKTNKTLVEERNKAQAALSARIQIEVSNLIKDADKLIENGECLAAKQKLSEALKLDSTNTKINYLLKECN